MCLKRHRRRMIASPPPSHSQSCRRRPRVASHVVGAPHPPTHPRPCPQVLAILGPGGYVNSSTEVEAGAPIGLVLDTTSFYAGEPRC